MNIFLLIFRIILHYAEWKAFQICQKLNLLLHICCITNYHCKGHSLYTFSKWIFRLKNLRFEGGSLSSPANCQWYRNYFKVQFAEGLVSMKCSMISFKPLGLVSSGPMSRHCLASSFELKRLIEPQKTCSVSTENDLVEIPEGCFDSREKHQNQANWSLFTPAFVVKKTFSYAFLASKQLKEVISSVS